YYEDEAGGSAPCSLRETALYCIGRTIHEKRRIPPLATPLPAELANSLISCMRHRRLLNSDTISLFDNRFTVTEADLSFCEASASSLRILRQHRLRRLSLCHTKMSNSSCLDLHVLIRDLGPRTLANLEYLNISGSVSNILGVLKLRSLSTLIVSESQSFGDCELKMICEFMPRLSVIDFSTTAVTIISPLTKLQNLKVLVMHRVRLSHAAGIDPESGIVPTLRSLRKLTYVDVSDRRIDVTTYSSDEPVQVDVGAIIVSEVLAEGRPWWPDLHVLDVAGSGLQSDGLDAICERVTNFITLHPRLEYISILDTPLNRHPYQYPYQRDLPLQVANGGTRAQCLLALQRYWRADREAFTAHSLQAVYYLLQSSYDEFQPADLRLAVRGIVLSMGNHTANLAIQMAGSACLYHLCKLKRSKMLTAMETRRCVDRCLDAAEKHAKILQLQKNVWLTICNDHLLQTQYIDMYRTCAVALEAMVNTRDPSVSRMTIAIVSILAPKIPTTQSHALATNQRYVRYLIDVIRDNISSSAAPNDNFNDFTIKFTLSALWNLTDESPETCQLFVELGGLNAALETLDRFTTSSNIQTKVLGLLNNVAEVKHLQESMLQPKCIESVLRLLDSDLYIDIRQQEASRRIDVSYFAAGILANLLLSRPWNFEPSSATCNQALIAAVRRWPNPILTMVAYRSFSPFFALLERDDLAGAQMWAAWAIQHVCSNDRHNGYVQMLLSQGGREVVMRLCNSKDAYPDAVTLAHGILELMDRGDPPYTHSTNNDYSPPSTLVA
uniref:Protein zer-1 homolog-like C-terminal domain-containing protein n=1 Tax=Parascaris univalens TaxID=6257 RepID=A0A915A5W9_PARUN